MEGTEPTTRVETTGTNGNPEADGTGLLSSKPLHRFVQREPKCLGVIHEADHCAYVIQVVNTETDCVVAQELLMNAFSSPNRL